MELLSQIFFACGAQGPPPLVIGVGLEVFATPLENCGNSSPPPLENREGSLSRVKIARALPLQAPSNGVPNFGGVLLTVEEMFRVRVGWEVSFRLCCVAVLDVAAAPVEGVVPSAPLLRSSLRRNDIWGS